MPCWVYSATPSGLLGLASIVRRRRHVGLGSSLRRSSICTASTGWHIKCCQYLLYALARLSSVILPTNYFSIGATLALEARTILLDCGRLCWYSTTPAMFHVTMSLANNIRIDDRRKLVKPLGLQNPEHLTLRTQLYSYTMRWTKTPASHLVGRTFQHPFNQIPSGTTCQTPRPNAN